MRRQSSARRRLDGHERHHVAEVTICETRIGQGDDTRVHEFCHQRDLTLESPGANGIREIGRDHLDRDVANEVIVMCAVHDGHATVPDFAVEQDA